MLLLPITRKNIKRLLKVFKQHFQKINSTDKADWRELFITSPKKLLKNLKYSTNCCYSLSSHTGPMGMSYPAYFVPLFSNARPVSPQFVRSIGFTHKTVIDELERMANQSPKDPDIQSIYLRSVITVDPEYVVRRVESGKYAINDQVRDIYMDAVSRTNSGSQSVSNRNSNINDTSFLKRIINYILKSGRNMISLVLTTLVLFVIIQWILTNVKIKYVKDMNLPSMLGSNFNGTDEIKNEDITVRFSDVKGNEETKQEVMEIVDFLKNPSKYTRLGGRISHGVLLIGPPGTGKTLLAKAIAGEANVPFYYTSGSEFDEIFVGVGASRIRKLFAKARANAPCIIFIDELDAVGSKRSESDLSPATRMTLNQLLTEMDGFKDNNVIVIGATNSPKVLDPALVRAGRFDIQVNVPLPCYKDRVEILNYYLEKISKGIDIRVDRLASLTPGASGADLANLVNQGAIRAVTIGRRRVDMEDLEWARDKILMGRERRNYMFTEEEKKLTAYHEAGHAMVAYFTKGARKLHKATIIPRGNSLGMTQLLPEKDDLSFSYLQLLAQIDVCMGGRAAEELIYGKENITTGSSSDLENATNIAKKMVTDCGFSSRIGLSSLETIKSSPHSHSSELDLMVQEEVKIILEESYKRVVNLLTKQQKKHHMLAEALMEHETLDTDQIEAILS